MTLKSNYVTHRGKYRELMGIMESTMCCIITWNNDSKVEVTTRQSLLSLHMTKSL